MSDDRNSHATGGSPARERSTTDQDAEALGVQKRPHGDVERWLEDNLEEEQGPVSHAEQPDKDVQSTATPLSAAPDEDNLVQLPAGATFGSGHEPSPQEREELLRFAAAADAELSAGDEGGHAESEPRRPEQDGDAGQ